MAALRSVLAGSLVIALLATPQTSEAQLAGKVPRVGYVTSGTRSSNVDAFEQGLREAGYVVGQSIKVDYRFGEGHVERVPELVDEVLRLGPDVLFAANPYVIRVARRATTAVPIVGIDLETNPVEAGWIVSWARPGGNLTGFFLDLPELSAKLLEFLTDTIPRLRRATVVWNPELAGAQLKSTESAARAARLELRSLVARQPEEFATAFEAARRDQAQAVVLLSSPAVFLNLRRIADEALQARLPAISLFPQFAHEGGLMGYGPNLPDLYRRGAGYVDRIVRGAKPAELPIQRPVVFELAVNLKTAKALGLTIPPPVLTRADQVID